LDESYGRVCTVDTKVIRFDGDLYDVVEDHAFEMIAGHPGYQTFRVGKKAAGRTLDERTWDEMPEGQR
jgi:protein gp37